jgi:hypothetical protein
MCKEGRRVHVHKHLQILFGKRDVWLDCVELFLLILIKKAGGIPGKVKRALINE